MSRITEEILKQAYDNFLNNQKDESHKIDSSEKPSSQSVSDLRVAALDAINPLIEEKGGIVNFYNFWINKNLRDLFKNNCGVWSSFENCEEFYNKHENEILLYFQDLASHHGLPSIDVSDQKNGGDNGDLSIKVDWHALASMANIDTTDQKDDKQKISKEFVQYIISEYLHQVEVTKEKINAQQSPFINYSNS